MIIGLDPHGGSPARQIHDQISGLITTGLLGTGERLPSVRQLASDLEVAPGTVAKAYRSLEAEGMVVSRVGSGTRVSEQAAVVPSSVAQAARRLVTTSRREGLDLDATIRVLRTMW